MVPSGNGNQYFPRATGHMGGVIIHDFRAARIPRLESARGNLQELFSARKIGLYVSAGHELEYGV